MGMESMNSLVRACGQLTVADLFLLSLIASGIDSAGELVERSGMAERTVFKRVRVLCAESWIQDGRLRVSENPALVQTRRHPHQRGRQVLLTDDGERLLSMVNDLTGQKTPAVA